VAVVPQAVFRRAAHYVYARPLVQVAMGAIIIAIAFPASPAGTLALGALAACAGVAVMELRVPTLPAWLGTATVIALIVALGISAFWEPLTTSPDWQLGDWGPQHAVVARILPSLPGFDVPVWNHAVATGDAPLELYPAFTTLLVGHVALLTEDIPLALMIVAIVVHIALAVLTALIAMRIASRKLALVVGLAFLVDSGAVSHGGTVGLFRWAILHTAVAEVFALVAVLGVLAALRKPRLGVSVTIWIATAIASAAHPAALLMVAAAVLALLAVALLAEDVPKRRALVAVGHLLLGVSLGALVWVPASERLLAYGQQFANQLYSPADFLHTILKMAMPISAYALLVYAGYIGIVAGVLSRRAEVVFVTATALVLILGVCELPYFAIMPGPTTARLGAMRMMMLARPLVFASAACLFALVGSQLVVRRRVVGALLGLAAGVGLRVLPVFWRDETQRAYEQTQAFAPDPQGRDALVTWARGQNVGPQSWGRALFEQDTHEQLHLTALTGLPTLHMGALPDLLLRERIADTSPESLRRFNVRWIVGVDASPKLGDPATEITVGSFHIREVPGWDGKFARVEQGQGDVIVHRLDDRVVDVELVGTREPALVVLGTGYYPRWRARHESGKQAPVTPLATAGTHVVAAWLAPGRTRFTVDGPLPSDGAGRLPAALALLCTIAIVVVWSRPRWRSRVLRRAAHVRLRLPRVAIPIALALVVLAGIRTTVAPARAFLVGTGVRPVADVEARLSGGAWTSCEYVVITGEYDCDGLVTVNDSTGNLVNDAPPSWPLLTPAVVVHPYGPLVEVRVRRSLRLAGRYTMASSAPLTVSIDGRDHAVDGQGELELSDGVHDVIWSGSVPFPGPLRMVLVQNAALTSD
jgi:hypothetical protein